MTELPRRAFLGAELPADREAFSADGLLIAGVRPAGMAASAGLAAGDRLIAVGGLPVRTAGELAVALRAAGRGETIELRFRRRDQDHSVEVAVTPAPAETIAGAELSYEAIDRGELRLRALISTPTGAAPRGAVLVLPGIACESVEAGGGPTGPLVDLIHGWAGAGYATFRFDKRGVGDSEGGPCGAADFDTELADARAALDQFALDRRTAGLPQFLFGHSVGGAHLALLAAALPDARLITSGCAATPWLDCVVASARRQLALRSVAPDEIEARAAALRDRALTDGLNGRSGTYHRQLAGVDLAAAWDSLAGRRLLVLRGEHDWVVDPDEQAELVRRVGASADLIEIPGVDHLLGWHPDRAASLRDYGAGRSNPTIATRSLEWMEKQRV